LNLRSLSGRKQKEDEVVKKNIQKERNGEDSINQKNIRVLRDHVTSKGGRGTGMALSRVGRTKNGWEIFYRKKGGEGGNESGICAAVPGKDKEICNTLKNGGPYGFLA